jgi:L-ascorbate metabolism protein UlaG (beta-lactamase superfamily)
MHNQIYIVVIALVLIAIAYSVSRDKTDDRLVVEDPVQETHLKDVEIVPISHATAVIKWDDTVFYTDPVGGADVFVGQPGPDIILITDIHGDHLDIETLEAIVGNETVLVVPPAVAELLPAESGNLLEPLASRAVVLQNGESSLQEDFTLFAIPMYNLPEADDSRHTKGRGNGYVVEKDDKRVYIAGDTADIPEMRSLENIDIALVPMNLPFTMDVDTAADAVLEFKPTIVYPYHYRSRDGLSDVGRFKDLVIQGNPEINVIILDWYPE